MLRFAIFQEFAMKWSINDGAAEPWHAYFYLSTYVVTTLLQNRLHRIDFHKKPSYRDVIIQITSA